MYEPAYCEMLVATEYYAEFMYENSVDPYPTELAVLRLRLILIRIRILGSVSLITDPDPTQNLT